MKRLNAFYCLLSVVFHERSLDISPSSPACPYAQLRSCRVGSLELSANLPRFAQGQSTLQAKHTKKLPKKQPSFGEIIKMI